MSEGSAAEGAPAEVSTPREDPDPLFADLITGPGCRIVKTEMRAISLIQLGRIMDHITRRLIENKEVWRVDRYENGMLAGYDDLTDPKEINLYHACKYVIKPATERQQLSLVEVMATQDQPPDYFTSHWWGEAVYLMLNCLRQFSADRGLQTKRTYGIDLLPNPDYLGQRSPCFWICAYANNQHKLSEELGIGMPLAETSFCLAMGLAKGTVSVVDANGVSWSRIWCTYELYLSVVEHREDYTYDLYTALEHTPRGSLRTKKLAVGITQGLVHIDEGQVGLKSTREEHFPLELIDHGVSFKCEEGNASVEADKVKILSEIAGNTRTLDEKIHGVLAGGVLARVIRANDKVSDQRQLRYLEAVEKSPPPAWSLENHQQYNELESELESCLRAQILAFLPGPLQYELQPDLLPGCGAVAVEALHEKGIFTLHQLCGQFLLLDRDIQLMLQWLRDVGYPAGCEETTVLAIAKKMFCLLNSQKTPAVDTDVALPAQYMAYEDLQYEYTTTFPPLSQPFHREIGECMPGCGGSRSNPGVKALEAAGIFTTDQLWGKFMLLDREVLQMFQWLQEINFPGPLQETFLYGLAAKLQAILD